VSFSPRILTVDDVLALHAIAIADQGGDPSIRDRGLLDSAVAVPAQQFSGRFLHPDIPAMAAAYAFHICQNHPFVDGNKRAAIGAMIAFLSDNAWSFEASADIAEPVVLKMAAGELGKAEFTEWLGKQVHEKPKLELREFFGGITADLFSGRFRSLLPAETSASPSEFATRVEEAAISMPFMRRLAQEQSATQQSGDAVGYERITMLAVGMITLYALAEDQGYEW
jgi:death-on-curing protein